MWQTFFRQTINGKRSLLIIFALIASVALTGCDKDLVCIGKEEEIQIGNHLTAGVLRELGGEADDLEMQKLVTRVGKTIADKSDRQDVPWEFYYVNSEVPNAVSLPGHVFITRGLVNQIKGEDGQVDVDMLSGVMAHEIAHVVARHIARSVAEERFADLLEAGLDLMTKRDVTADEGALFMRQFLQRGYRRGLEEEADRLGAIYAARAGYSKDGLLRAAQRMLKVESRYPNDTAWYLRTHPYTMERVKSLDLQLPSLDDETIKSVAYKTNDHCKGWWGLLNLGVQFVRAKYILKSGAQIELADSSGRGYPDTVVRSDGQRKVWYQADNQARGLFKVATSIGPNGQPLYTGVVGYSPEAALTIKQKAIRLLTQGQTQLAIKDLNRAIDLGATDAATRLALARAYAKVGNSALAQAAYRSVLREEWQGQQSDQATAALGAESVSTAKRPRQATESTGLNAQNVSVVGSWEGSIEGVSVLTLTLQSVRGRLTGKIVTREYAVNRAPSQAESAMGDFNRAVARARSGEPEKDADPDYRKPRFISDRMIEARITNAEFKGESLLLTVVGQDGQTRKQELRLSSPNEGVLMYPGQEPADGKYVAPLIMKRVHD